MWWRPLLLTVGIIAMMVINIRAIQVEKIEKQVQISDRVYADRLRDIEYSEPNRLNNFIAFGLNKAQASKAQRKAGQLMKKHAKQFRSRLSNAENEQLLVDTFCARTSSIRPRYSAINWLVKENNGRREVIDPVRDVDLQEQEWAGRVSLEFIYQDLELREDPRADSTKMAIAALLTGNESALTNRDRPYGEGDYWRWDEVLEQHPKVEKQLVEYFAIMHVFVELANSSDGICQ